MEALTEGEAGQSVSLISVLQGLLHEYAGGIGIAKELLQNADDAGATWIRFALDLREHPRERLPDPRMGPLLGPALLVTSNQVFSDTDLVAIEKIGLGAKRDRPGKTGRFGVGFNACYHITDYPSFATGPWIVCFDPHQDAVAKGARHGFRWPLAKAWEKYPDWPRAFALREGVIPLTETTFRFPLRTKDQASPTRLSTRPFPPEEALALFEDLQRWGGGLLLFLHNVLDLQVDILRQSGVEWRLRVTTTDPEAVVKERARVLETGEAKLESWLKDWHAGQTQSLETLYEHRFTVETPEVQREDRFLVARALVSGSPPLLNAAMEMVACSERAVPRVGAALQLAPDTGLPLQPRVDQRLSCTLPLAQRADIPFFLDGAFDLNNSRTHLTYDAPAGDQAVRSRWNKALLTEASPRMIVLLLHAARERVGERDPAAFYSLWPALQEAGPIRDLSLEVYRRIAREPLLRIRESGQVRWVTPDQAVAPAEWSAELRKALIADGLSLVDPLPPQKVLDGLVSAGASPKTWPAEGVRAWLRVSRDPDCPIERAPLKALRTRELVVELFRRYGVGERVDRSGLPLALMADGTLRAFGCDNTLFIAPSELQRLFPDSQHMFLDAAFVDEAGVKEDSRVRLHRAGVATVIRSLSKYLRPSSDHGWLLQILQYLSQHKLEEHRTELRALCLLPDQSGQLQRADAPVPPLHIHEGTGTPGRLKQVLLQLQIPVLSASKDLVAYLGLTSRKMVPADGTDLLPPLTGEAVALALSPQGVDAAPPETRETLVEWLASEHQRIRLSPAALERLQPLKLWLDEAGVPAAASEPGLFLPTGYRPPPHLAQLRLLRSGAGERWRPLLTALGIPELNRARVIEMVVRDSERAVEDDGRVLNWLRWLRDETDRERITEEEGEKRAEEIGALLRSRPIIPSTAGRRLAMNELYHPDAKDVDEVLGPRARHPAPSLLGDKEELSRWLKWMGLGRQVAATDLFARIGDLVQEAAVSGVAAVTGPLLRILEYLSDDKHWERMKALAPHLTALAWVPGSGDQLYRPNQMFPEVFRNLVASQAPLLGVEPDRAVCEALGIPTEVPLAVAVAHLRRVRELWQMPDHGGLGPQAIEATSKEFLRRLGPPYEEGLTQPEKALIGALAREPCLWHPATQRFWPPGYVFLQRVPGLEPLRVHIDAEDAERAGLRQLGVRDVPEPKDLVGFLHELAELHRGKVLLDEPRRSVLWAWRQLDEAKDEAALQGHPPVLTRGGLLLEPGLVLEDDAPWWSSRLRDAEIPFREAELPAGATRAAGVLRASEAIDETLVGTGSEPLPEVTVLVAQLEQHLGEVEFQRGLVRLVAHAHDSAPEDALGRIVGDVLRLRLGATSSLRTELRCPPLGRVGPFGEGEAESLLVEDRLLLALDDKELAAHEVAGVINRRLPAELRLQDLSNLEAIIRCPPGSIDAVLDRRKVRASAAAVEVSDLSDLDPVEETEPTEPTPIVPLSIELPPTEPIEVVPPVTEHTDGAARRPGEATLSGVVPIPSGPPLMPGDGTSHVPVTQQRRGRLRSYVLRTNASLPGGPGRSLEDFTAHKRAAVEHVVAEARERGWGAEELGSAFPGHDVRLEVPGEPAPRCVVVVGLAGAWDRAGVPLTKTQLQEAQDKREQFWIHVVEHALDPAKRCVTPFQDPWGKANEFRFDDGWREVAEVPPKSTPTAGLALYKGNELLGVITKVAPMGLLYLLHVQAPDGKLRVITYSPTNHLLAAPELHGPNDS